VSDVFIRFSSAFRKAAGRSELTGPAAQYVSWAIRKIQTFRFVVATLRGSNIGGKDASSEKMFHSEKKTGSLLPGIETWK
jgi:hypothetical protein